MAQVDKQILYSNMSNDVLQKLKSWHHKTRASNMYTAYKYLYIYIYEQNNFRCFFSVTSSILRGTTTPLSLYFESTESLIFQIRFQCSIQIRLNESTPSIVHVRLHLRRLLISLCRAPPGEMGLQNTWTPRGSTKIRRGGFCKWS